MSSDYNNKGKKTRHSSTIIDNIIASAGSKSIEDDIKVSNSILDELPSARKSDSIPIDDDIIDEQ